MSASVARSSKSAVPLVEIITGSSMTAGLYFRSTAATACIFSRFTTMPTFTASGGISSNTARSCSSTTDAFTGSTRNTPQVFWTVIAVRALIPYRPNAPMVFKSAWIPAPPLQSDPAIVRTVFIRLPPFQIKPHRRKPHAILFLLLRHRVKPHRQVSRHPVRGCIYRNMPQFNILLHTIPADSIHRRRKKPFPRNPYSLPCSPGV